MDEKLEEFINRYKKETEKECYQFSCVDGDASILDDKIGGYPYLPVGVDYPTDKNGNFMPLLIQVNLKNINLEGWPQSGILEVFVDKDLDYPCQYVIKYFENGLEYQTEFPNIDMSNFVVNEPIKIEVNKGICHMPFADYRFEEIACRVASEVYGKKFNDSSELDEVMDDWDMKLMHSIHNPAGTIGGYADFTQQDPRYDTNDNLDECLIKLDSNLDSRLYIGDAGILFVLISLDDIRNKDFSKAIVDWDCC